MVIAGRPGVGKTRLAREAAAAAIQSGLGCAHGIPELLRLKRFH